jgi:hypothetical protein
MVVQNRPELKFTAPALNATMSIYLTPAEYLHIFQPEEIKDRIVADPTLQATSESAARRDNVC